MAYKLNEEAVEIFMGAFYYALLVDRAPVEHATRIARRELLRDRSRRAWYMQRVRLADYVVPMLYVSHLGREAPGAGSSNATAIADRIFGPLGRAASATGCDADHSSLPSRREIPESYKRQHLKLTPTRTPSSRVHCGEKP